MSYQHKKRFGQHFLHDGNIIRKILEAARLDGATRVLEIGPGLGALTGPLLQQAGEVHVMEIDRDLIAELLARPESNLVVHAGDALHLDWAQLLTAPPYTLVSNLPYNISTQIVFRLLDQHRLFTRMILMFQKEVGDRLMAAPGGKDYGILSVLCRQYFDLYPVVRVRPGCFTPPPKVESIVVRFEPLAAARCPVPDERLLPRLVKAAFNQRRKTLRNSLRATGFAAETLDAAMAQAQIDPGLRGEALALEDYARLCHALTDVAALPPAD